jgi:hypothetical protein
VGLEKAFRRRVVQVAVEVDQPAAAVDAPILQAVVGKLLDDLYDSLLSGRNSTYRPVQISGTGSVGYLLLCAIQSERPFLAMGGTTGK